MATKKRKKKRRRLRKWLVAALLILFVLVIGGIAYLIYDNIQGNKTEIFYLASDQNILTLNDRDGNPHDFIRGQEVNIKKKKYKKDDIEFNQFEENGVTYLVSEDVLVTERKDSVRESVLYALRSHVLTSEYGDYHISGWVSKKDELQVNGYHELKSDGTIDAYFVNNAGYISSDYVSLSYYETAYDMSIYDDVWYGEGGKPSSIELYPKEAYTPRTPMPERVNALYINAEAIVSADAYIELAQECSGINAFVVDIKDCYVDTQLAYDSPVSEIYAPSTYNIPNSYDTYKENVRKLKDAGYYLIGRITAFKDDSFAVDNPSEALIYYGDLYRYGAVRWPSIFSRKMWEYDVALALEAAEEMGFDEIQFDYVRLPEDVEDVDLKNTYGETRAEAITNFLRYAAEILHSHGINISADVFGETSGNYSSEFSCFVSYYGQFWPAISNTVDAISSMPYPDHFSYYAYGIEEPWLEPGNLMYEWGKATYYAQEKTYDPAKCRTWIMAQDSDPYDVYYDASFVEAQIDGLRRANVFDGYMTWNAASSISKYYTYTDVLN